MIYKKKWKKLSICAIMKTTSYSSRKNLFGGIMYTSEYYDKTLKITLDKELGDDKQ